ncbi:MAG: hypothetical protein EZS28_037925 [Streblomastix strix]|uniref:Uncharacterized protein n=1 Tax=Streblomastix strix TaxID=222440 RepID=A0A5J4U886_9EUKA|nr:MAG: hypothetical protein EZS28_037925 [Streblomastix strix]
MNPYPSLVRLLSHQNHDVVKFAIGSIFNLFFNGGVTNILICNHYETFQECDGIQKIDVRIITPIHVLAKPSTFLTAIFSISILSIILSKNNINRPKIRRIRHVDLHSEIHIAPDLNIRLVALEIPQASHIKKNVVWKRPRNDPTASLLLLQVSQNETVEAHSGCWWTVSSVW